MNRTIINTKYLGIRYLSLLFFLMTFQAVIAQINCTEITSEAGIDYHFSSVTYMGGGAAFFDMDNDGDDDIWIAGGVERDVLYENDGSGNFTEIGETAGLNATIGHVNSGIITGDLDNDGFRDVMTLPHIGHAPYLFKNNGDGTFTEISETAGLSDFKAQSHAAAMGDVNLDGYLDIYVATYVETINNINDGMGNTIGFDHDCFDNLLFINNGDWTFTEMGNEYSVKNGGCALATTFTDYDNDNDPDLMIANDFGAWIAPNALYQNEHPNNQFSDISQSSGANPAIYGMGIAVGDYDRDLDLDYYITNLGRNVLLDNKNDGTFEDKTTEKGVEDTMMDSLLATGWGTAFIDMDNDLDLDLFVCNGYVPAADFIKDSKQNRNRLFLNDGTGFNFSETAFDSGLDDPGRGRGFAYSDYDNDGDLDILVINVNLHTGAEPIDKVLLFRNDSGQEKKWLKVNLEGITNNRDGFGSTMKIVVGGFSWIHDYNGGFGSHASQHSSTAHFGLGDFEMVDSLIITWPGGEQNHFTDISSNQTIKIKEDGTLTDTKELENFDKKIQLTAFPNPFSNQTQIRFQLPTSGEIELDIFDSLGRKIEQINKGWMIEGVHLLNWNLNENLTSSNWYLIRLKIDNQIITKKIIQNLR